MNVFNDPALNTIHKQNIVICHRFTLINSRIVTAVASMAAWGSISPNRISDWVVANNNIETRDRDLDPSLDNPGFGWRMQGVSNIVMTDNRIYTRNRSNATPWGVRIHADPGITTRNIYIGRNQLEGIGHATTRTGDNVGPFGSVENIHWDQNDIYILASVTFMAPINTWSQFDDRRPNNGSMNITNNNVYAPQGINNLSGAAANFNWNVQGNSHSSSRTPPTWNC